MQAEGEFLQAIDVENMRRTLSRFTELHLKAMEGNEIMGMLSRQRMTRQKISFEAERVTEVMLPLIIEFL
jgi:hypothetical protein